MNDLVPIKSGVPAFSMSEVERIAGAIAKSGMFGLKDPYGVLTLCLLAQAEGQHPAVVFRDYSVISGKPAKKAEAMLRDFINSGGKVEWHQLDDDGADATFTHPAGSARISWDKERAKKAQLGSNGMYAKYPRQMFRSRVISEGVRTVYPGATSGLYVPEEVASFEPARDGTLISTNAAPPEPVEHDEETGEIIERQKVAGIHKIKERLRPLLAAGGSAETLDDFNALVSQHKDDLQKIKDANHEWWTGDSDDFEGFKSFIKRRREELTPQPETLSYQLLCSTLQELRTYDEYLTWFGKHGDAVGELDGEESRKFEELHDAKVAAMKNPTPLEAGLIGG
jgi:hypothetical protein